MFAGPYPPNPAELVGCPVFKEILDSVRDDYDYIIVDAPPLGLVIDAAIMASVCDGAVIVINQGVIKHRIAQDVKAQLSKSGCRILGVVLNQTQRKKRGVRGQSPAYYSHYGEYYSADAVKGGKIVPPATTMARGSVRMAPPPQSNPKK